MPLVTNTILYTQNIKRVAFMFRIMYVFFFFPTINNNNNKNPQEIKESDLLYVSEAGPNPASEL